MKILKKSIAFVMAAALIATSLSATSADAAKKPKLSKKAATITVGSSVKITVKNANKKAKVTWKLAKKSKSIVKIAKKKTKGKKAYAQITGLKAGKATLTATYKAGGLKKKLKCKITVNPAQDSAAPTAPAGASTTAPAGTDTATATPDGSGTSTGTAKPADPTSVPTLRPTNTPRPSPTPSPVPTPAIDVSATLDLSEMTTLENAATYVDGKVIVNDTRPNENDNSTVVYLPLPGTIGTGETVTIVFSGSVDATCQGFRIWVGDGPNSLSDNIQTFNNLTAGPIQRQFTITANGECSMLTIKSTSWNGPVITGLTVEEVTVYYTDRGAVVGTPKPAATNPPAATDVPYNFTLEDSFEPGSKYMLLFNNTAVNASENLYYENTGTLYALTNTTSSNGKTFTTEISADRAGITVDPDTVLASTWLVETYNNTTGQFTFKNLSSNQYLNYGGGNVVGFTDAVSASNAFILDSKTGEGFGIKTITPISENGRVLRISNGSSVFRFGDIVNTATDGRNGNVYIYKLKE